jgi:hypothetical protein
MRSIRFGSLVIGLLLVVAFGCSQGGVSGLVPVSGRVQMDRKPLVGATVRFFPEGHKTDPKKFPVAEGVTDAEGRYTLKVEDAEGCVPGRCKVEISHFDRKPFISGGKKAEAGRELVPGAYNVNSKLTFTVSAEGTKEANFFDLHSEAGSGADTSHRER